MINTGFGVGMFSSGLMGLIIPLEDGQKDSIQKMKDDTNWRFTVLAPMIMASLTIFITCINYKELSIVDLLQSNDPESDEKAEIEIKKVYTIDESKLTYVEFAEILRG